MGLLWPSCFYMPWLVVSESNILLICIFQSFSKFECNYLCNMYLYYVYMHLTIAVCMYVSYDSRFEVDCYFVQNGVFSHTQRFCSWNGGIICVHYYECYTKALLRSLIYQIFCSDYQVKFSRPAASDC